MRVGLDIDGVLCSFNEAFAHQLVKVTGTNKMGPVTQETFHCWHWMQAHGYTEEEVAKTWKTVHTDSWWWLRLKALPGMTSLYEAAETLKEHDVYFITAREGLKAKSQTEVWLQTRGFENPTVIMSPHKGSLAAVLQLDAIIDDRPEHLESVQDLSPQTRTYLLEASWNVAHPRKNMLVVPSVHTFLELEGLRGRI